jgi:hypothetical protein
MWPSLVAAIAVLTLSFLVRAGAEGCRDTRDIDRTDASATLIFVEILCTECRRPEWAGEWIADVAGGSDAGP